MTNPEGPFADRPPPPAAPSDESSSSDSWQASSIFAPPPQDDAAASAETTPASAWAAPGSAPAPGPAPSANSPWANPSSGHSAAAPGGTAPAANPYPTPPGASPYAAPGPNPYNAPGANPYGSPVTTAAPGQAFPAPSIPGQPPGYPAHPSPGQIPGAVAPPMYGGQAGRYWNAFKPGIVTLRPMALGDVFGGAFSLVRYNPKASIGLTAMLLVLGVAIGVPLSLLAGRGLQQYGQDGESAALGFGVLLTSSIPSLMIGLLATPLLSRTTYEAIIGNKASIGQVWERTRSRILPYIGATLLLGLAGGAVGGFSVFLLVVLARDASAGAMVAISLLLFTALLVAFTVLSIRLFAFPSAIVLEGSGVWESFRRSWALTAGAFWRVLGYLLLIGLVLGVIRYAIQAPIGLLALVLASAWAPTDDGAAVAASLGQVLGQQVALVLTVPITTAFYTLLWADLRIRREGFDLTLIEQASANEQASQHGIGTR